MPKRPKKPEPPPPVERRDRQLAAVVAILSGVYAAKSVDEICKFACGWASELFGFASVTILLEESDGEHVRVAGAAGETRLAVGKRFEIASMPIYRKARATGVPVIERDMARLRKKWTILSELHQKGVRSLAVIPLGPSTRIRGVLGMAARNSDDIDDDLVGVLVDIGRAIDVAIEKAELVESMRRQVEDTARVRDVSAEIAGMLSLEPLLDRVASGLAAVANASQAFIMLYEPAVDALVGVASTEPREAMRNNVRRDVKHERSLAVEAWRTRKAIVVEDASKDPRVNRRLVRLYGEKSLLAIPLLVGEKAIGAVMLGEQRRRRRSFTPDEIARSQTVANQAALAIENARTHDAAIRARDRAELLLEVVRVTGGGVMNPREFLSTIAERIYTLTGASWCAIAIPDDSERAIADVVHHGSPPELRAALEKLVGRRFDSYPTGRRVLEEERGFVIEDVVRARLFSRRLARTYRIRSLLIVPVRTQCALLAIFALGYWDYWPEQMKLSAEEIALAEGVARQVALALTNARAFDEIARQQRALDRLTARMLGAQEEERRRIARELHDGVNQQLAAATLFLERLVGRARRGGGAATLADVGPDLGRVSQAIGEVIREIRRLCIGLRPLELDHLGFAAAVRAFGRTFAERTGIEVAVELGQDLPRLDAAVEINLYRIVQEALANVARHARARRVEVRVRLEGARVALTIEDDGCGFEPRRVERRREAERGLGLLTMAERARLLCGELKVRSGDGEGTRIEVTAPIGASQVAAAQT